MKRITILFVLGLIFCGLGAVSLTGHWYGELDATVMKLRLVLHITENPEGGIAASLDSPDQDAYGFEAEEASYEDGLLKLVFNKLLARYEGELKDEKLVGTFIQMGKSIALELSQEVSEAPVYNRPQEPKEPFPYLAQEVIFPNPKAGINLAATLTLPDEEGVFTGVVLVSGSGPQNRNEELMKHKPFLVIADYLTQSGIAVLRYDDRGVAESEGDFDAATTFDFADDAISAALWLKNHPNIGKVGIIGHSEGGLIAPIAANQCPEIDFIVMLAGTGLRGDEILITQVEAILRSNGVDEEIIAKTMEFNRKAYDLVLETEDEDALGLALGNLIKEAWESEDREILFENQSMEEIETSLNLQLLTPWMLNFIRTDPRPYLENLSIPVLALFGEKDLQVLPKPNLAAVEAALNKAGNTSFKTIEYEGLNHLFQHSETGNPNEYGSIEETFADTALRDIAKWISELK